MKAQSPWMVDLLDLTRPVDLIPMNSLGRRGKAALPFIGG